MWRFSAWYIQYKWHDHLFRWALWNNNFFFWKLDVWNLSEEKHLGTSSVPQRKALMVLDQTIFVCFCVYVLKMRCRTLSTLGKHSITSVLHARTVRGSLCIFRPTLSPLTPLISLTNRSNNQVIFKQRLTGLRAL